MSSQRGRTRVAVIGGGQNCEHEVSLASAASVADGLPTDRYDVVALTIGVDGKWCDADAAPLAGGVVEALEIVTSADVVFPVVHGPRGEDGALAGLCELAGVPYVGSGVRAGALAMDKWVTKLIADELGIRTAAGVLICSESAESAGHLDLPLVVKPVSAGSSHGVSRVDTPGQLARAIDDALGLDDRVLVERLIRGREIDIAVLERADGSRLVGPPLEIVVGANALFDTGKKYDGSADFRVPANVAAAESAALTAAATALFDAMGCTGIARFDFFVTVGGLVLNEVNTMPGMTAQSQVPKMFAAVGLPYGSLLGELVDGALARAA